MKLKTRTLSNEDYYNQSLPLKDRLTSLLNELTLNEKFKLLSGKHFSLWKTKPIRRLKVKSLGMTDGPNGVGLHSSFKLMTKFPCTKCFSATWNRVLADIYGITIAKEVRAANRHVLLAPGINIDRTPLNGRTFEYFSEDPYLTKELAIPFVKGIQSQRIGACVKHYAVNNQETNRKTISSEVDDRTLNEIYLRAFRDVVQEADPWSFMGSYNKINGVYACENTELLRDMLIDQWGFTGYIVSDWWATSSLKKPENCIKAGLSLEMPKPYAYKMKRLKDAFKEGKFSKEELDFVIKRLLRVMFLVGLFDHKTMIPKGERNTTSNQLIAKKIAEDGLVLLKNECNILPLDITKIKEIAVLGPNKNKRMGKFLYGGSAAVVPPFEITPLKGIKEKLKKGVKISTNPKSADYCIIFAGLNHDKFKDSEDWDRICLELPKDQIELINETIKVNSKTIVVLINGSPIAMNEWINNVPAILEAWYPGMMGGHAIANVLFGEINPSGKLPITFPMKLSDSPAHKSERTFPGKEKVQYEEGIFVGYRHFDKEKISPQFPFGYGLSYTTFKYDNFALKSTNITDGQTVDVLIDITNIGEVEGAEIVQLYVRDDKCTLDRPPKELIGFEKITLAPKETKTVVFGITTDDLSFYEPIRKAWVIEPGTFTIMIGSSSQDIYAEKTLIYEP
ncbi:MAG: glycoside hydrolase family 3 C-terminal domain-containing protein [Candidatus Heimdallarchaeota archaeon]|nr:glycoside hydrolase family 3 C-terminal domain-containing protein [Candidatus Heimdallarchaeota archaeon]